MAMAALQLLQQMGPVDLCWDPEYLEYVAVCEGGTDACGELDSSTWLPDVLETAEDHAAWHAEADS